HTPTEAAQVIVAHWRTAPGELRALSQRLRRGLRERIQDAGNRLSMIRRHDIFRRPVHRLNLMRQNLDDQQRRLTLVAMRVVRRGQGQLVPLEALMTKCHPRHDLQRRREQTARLAQTLERDMHSMRERLSVRLDAVQRTLDALSPQGVLGRGYSITRLKRSGKLL